MKQNENNATGNTKNKGGRPQIAVKKNKVITVKCNAQEKLTIKGKARELKITASEFLRELGIKGKIDRLDREYPKEALDLIKLVNNIANNINQITKKLNSTGQLTAYLQEQLEFHLGELRKIEYQVNSYFL